MAWGRHVLNQNLMGRPDVVRMSISSTNRRKAPWCLRQSTSLGSHSVQGVSGFIPASIQGLRSTPCIISYSKSAVMPNLALNPRLMATTISFPLAVLQLHNSAGVVMFWLWPQAKKPRLSGLALALAGFKPHWLGPGPGFWQAKAKNPHQSQPKSHGFLASRPKPTFWLGLAFGLAWIFGSQSQAKAMNPGQSQSQNITKQGPRYYKNMSYQYVLCNILVLCKINTTQIEDSPYLSPQLQKQTTICVYVGGMGGEGGPVTCVVVLYYGTIKENSLLSEPSYVSDQIEAAGAAPSAEQAVSSVSGCTSAYEQARLIRYKVPICLPATRLCQGSSHLRESFGGAGVRKDSNCMAIAVPQIRVSSKSLKIG
ncbi:hypothetical protein B0H14DRAFT_2570120 [Mycena olivaceomarginata]|nr:hypothetical protein B0H14DRAFT_2570120 [Mycena olivaceomarginata]